MFLTKRATDFRDEVKIRCKAGNFPLPPYQLDITFHVPDRRRRDADNLIKPLFDALEHADVLTDDCFIYDYHVNMDPKNMVRGGQTILDIRHYDQN